MGSLLPVVLRGGFDSSFCSAERPELVRRRGSIDTFRGAGPPGCLEDIRDCRDWGSAVVFHDGLAEEAILRRVISTPSPKQSLKHTDHISPSVMKEACLKTFKRIMAS
jgi:hypothetical protein